MSAKRKILTLAIATILTICIILSVIFIGNLSSKPVGSFSLQSASREFGTITMECDYSNTSKTLAVSQTTEYINRSKQTLSEVKFHIYANAYKKNATYPPVARNEIAKAYPNGFSEGNIKVSTPHVGISGYDDTVLTVPLQKKLLPNEHVEIKLDYIVKLANIKHRLGYTDTTVNLGNFYAIPVVYDNGWEVYPYSSNGDPFYNDPYNFVVTLNAPKEFKVASSGEQIAPNKYRGYVLRDFAFVLSQDFNVISKKVGATMVNYYYLDDDIADISLHTATNALAYFSNEFYDYPYSTLAVVQTDFLHGGMEYGALVYIALDVTDQLQYQTVIVHEIAHQWWYGIIGNNQTRTAWIDEGLAEYSTAVFFETHPEYKRDLESIAKENLEVIKMFESIMEEYKVPYSKDLLKDLISYKSGYEYTINTYSRGMLLFYNISEMVGYKNLNSALSKFANSNRFGFGTDLSLISTLDENLGRDLTNYINKYLAGKQI